MAIIIDSITETYRIIDHFICPESDTGFTTTLSGAGASVNTNNTTYVTVDGRFGNATAVSGSTTTGIVVLRTGAASIAFGNSTWCSVKIIVAITSLSTVAEEFATVLGLYDNTGAGIDAVDGVYFKYDRLTDGNFWSCITVGASTVTKTVTAVPIVAGQFYQLDLWVNAADKAIFWIDGVKVAEHTTNIPSAGEFLGLMFKGIKSAGTTSVEFFALDFIDFQIGSAGGIITV